MPELFDPQLPEVDPPGFDTNEDLLTKGGYTNPEENPYYPEPPEQDKNSFGEIRKRVTQRRQEIQDRFFKKKPSSTPEAPPVEKPPTTKLSEPNTSSSSINAQHRIDLGKPSTKTAKELEEQAAKSSLKGVERKAITSNSAKFAARGAQQAGKQAVKQVEKKIAGAAIRRTIETAVSAGVGLLIDLAITVGVWIVKNGWRYILIGIAVLLLLLALIFGLQGGQTAPTPPSTQAEKDQAVEIAALSDDPTASAEVVFKKADVVKQRFVAIKAAATKQYKNNAAKLASANKDADEIITLLEQLKNIAGNKTERSKLVKTINDKVAAFQGTYSELVFQAGSCADLQKFIDNKQFVVGRKASAKNIVRGIMENKNNGKSPASQDLCGTLVYALNAGFKIYSGDLSYGHTVRVRTAKGFGTVSAHACGAAIDIGMINDEGVNPSSGETKKFLQTLADGGKAGKIYVQQAISPFREFYIKNNVMQYGKYKEFTNQTHQDHVHLSGRPMNPKCMTSGTP